MLDSDRLLDLYHDGRSGGTLARMALLARTAAGDEAGSVSLGELDRRIWALRADWLADGASGGQVGDTQAVCTCPACGGRLEFSLPKGFALPPPHSDSATVLWQGRSYILRLPRIGDIGPHGLAPETLGDAPWDQPGFSEAAAQALQMADPTLGLSLAMTCPECGDTIDEPFDPAAFFWAEIEDMARALLRDVIALARALGWSERDILAMSPARRALYLAEVSP